MFQNDRIHGAGKFTDVDETTYEGLWARGKREGWIKETDINGDSKMGEWIMGKFIGYENEPPLIPGYEKNRNSLLRRASPE